MGDDEKEKAEKLAAAKKRFEELKKQKKGKPGAKPASGTAKKKEQTDKTARSTDTAPDEAKAKGKEDEPEQEDAIQVKKREDKAEKDKEQKEKEEKEDGEEPADLKQPVHNRQPSLSMQSRMRSSSFRQGGLSQGPLSPSAANGSKSPELPPLTPDSDSINSIYRKQTTRLEELEKENKRLTKEVQESEKNLKRADEELDELREANGTIPELQAKANKLDTQTEELNKIKQENASLQRQASQLQSSQKKHTASPSQADMSSSSLQSQLDSKSSTIESMELELSNLRAQLDKSSNHTSTHSEQITALESRLSASERTASAAQRELADAKKAIERASEKAVREGSEKTSAETKMRSLERDAEQAQTKAAEHVKRIDALEKKLTALTTLHKEADVRRQAHERERDRLAKESGEMRQRFAGLENENLRLREERDRSRKSNPKIAEDDDGLDELEDAARQKLNVRIRDLEAENHDLRQGVWRDRRQAMQGQGQGQQPGSPSPRFDDVDLNGGTNGPYFASRRESTVAGRQTSTFAEVLSSGISAFTNNTHSAQQDGLLDDDGGFDEDAFRAAQEDEARKRVERVREIKRGLQRDWSGWRMDLVESRQGAVGLGMGEIFEV